MSAQILYEMEGRRIVVPIDRDELTIGRDPSNDVVIGQPYVSRWHAKVYMSAAGWRVMDLESKCGIQINDRETVDGALVHGDCIFIKDMCLTFMDQAGAVPPRSTASVVALTPAAANPGTVFRQAVDFAELGSSAADVERLQRLLKMVSETSDLHLVSHGRVTPGGAESRNERHYHRHADADRYVELHGQGHEWRADRDAGAVDHGDGR